MAINATDIFCNHQPEHRLTRSQCEEMCAVATYVNSAEDSKALSGRNGPMGIISASGMLSGGRILHHLKAFGGDPRNAVVLTGYQAAGTRGEALLNRARSLRIHGINVPIRADVAQTGGLSAHADHAEMSDWLGGLGSPPSRVFITHGEARASAALKTCLAKRLGWQTEIPGDGDTVRLDGATGASPS